MDERGRQFRRLLDVYDHECRKTRYLHNKYHALIFDEANGYDDTLQSTRRRKNTMHTNAQLKQINSDILSGKSLDRVVGDFLEDGVSEKRIQACWEEYCEQKQSLIQSRKDLAEIAGLPAKYVDTYKINVQDLYTHFYFGGTNGSNGDDGHGHYIIENATGLPIYQRDPFGQHGIHNVVRWVTMRP